MLTDIDIEDLLHDHIKDTDLMKAVNGVLRKNGARPAKSRKEDIVIHVLANVNGEIQQAIVYVDIYTQDVEREGEQVRNDKRCRELTELGRKALSWSNKGLTTIRTEEESIVDTEEGEHIVKFKLIVKHLNQNR